VVECSQRCCRIGQIKTRAGDRRKRTIGKMREHGLVLHTHGARARHFVGAPTDTDDRDVVEQKPVDFDFGNVSTGKADDEEPAFWLETAERICEPVSPDRVDHDVDAASLKYGVFKSFCQDELVSTCR